MLPSTSSAILSIHSISSPQSTSQEKTPSVARVDLIKNKLSSITPDQASEEINCFKAFFEKNEEKMLTLGKAGDSLNELLKTVATTLNTIRDNIATGDDNADNYIQLNQLKDYIDKLTQPGESKKNSIGERVGQKIDQVLPNVKKETGRIGKQFENKFKSTGAKIKSLF